MSKRLHTILLSAYIGVTYILLAFPGGPSSTFIRAFTVLGIITVTLAPGVFLFLDSKQQAATLGRSQRPSFSKRSWIAIAILFVVLATPLVMALPFRIVSATVMRQSDSLSARMSFAQFTDSTTEPITVGKHSQVVEPNRRNILVAGDSIMFGWGVEPNQDLSAHLQSHFPQHQVVNSAIPGYGVAHEYLYFQEFGPAIKPEATVVGYFIGNDLEQAMWEFNPHRHQPFYVPDGESIRLLGSEMSFPIWYGCNQLQITPILRPMWVFFPGVMAEASRDWCSRASLTEDEAITVIARLTAQFAADAEAIENEILFVLLPTATLYPELMEPFAPHVQGYNGLKQALNVSGVEWLDFCQWLKENPVDIERVFLHDHAHLTGYGNELLAQAIAERLGSLAHPTKRR